MNVIMEDSIPDSIAISAKKRVNILKQLCEDEQVTYLEF